MAGVKNLILMAVAGTLAVAGRADETISANVSLNADTDWRAKGVVTIGAGVTVTLNGHALVLAGLAGTGTITNPLVDLTTTDASCASSTTTFLGGSAANLFNNNFARNGTDNTRRIIVQKANLPLVVDYDFGEGNAQAINRYNVWCGPIQGYERRCPKAWTFAGSNDKTTWTTLDTRPSETGWASTRAECRTKTFTNTTAYRYYRFTATEAQSDTDGYLEMVQLEYFNTAAFADLRLDIPAETSVTNTGVAISGNTRLVKEGAGTFVAAKASQTYFAGTQINAGTFKAGPVATAAAYAGTGPITVAADATLDINGSRNFYSYAITLAGGTVANTGADLTASQSQLANLTLTADSFLDAQYSLGFVTSSGKGATSLNLNGHTLDVTIGPPAVFRFSNTDVTNGTVRVVKNAGIVSFVTTGSRTQTATLDFAEGRVCCYQTCEIGNLILRQGVTSWRGADLWFRLAGTFTPLTDDGFSNTLLLDGSTLDLAGRTNALNTVNSNGYTVTCASNATVTVNLAGRALALGERLLRWTAETRPTCCTFQFDATTAAAGITPVVTDTGLYYGADPESSVAEYAWWTGSGGDGSCSNAANWTCKNVAGNVIVSGLPSAVTTLILDGPTSLQVPAGTTLPCEAIYFNGCTLAADCDWRGLSGFTLRTGDVVSLNGHKLFVSGLAGDGEVTGGAFDLTTNDASKVSCNVSCYNSTVAANAFNNNYTRVADANHRVLVENANLPLSIDYDFGVPTYVDEYVLYVGPTWTSRSPRTWSVSGSNDAATWTLLDARTSPEISDNSLCRRFRIGTPAGYRYYRFTALSAIDKNDGFLEFVQLEYGDSRTVGELHVTVPEGSTLENSTVSLTGNLKLVKEGAGTFVATKNNQTYSGGTDVIGGELQDGDYDYLAVFGNAGAITVGPEGRFNLVKAGNYFYPVVGAGGVIYSSVGHGGDARTMPSLTLTADSVIDATKTMSLAGDVMSSGFNYPSALDLGGHTLDVSIGAGQIFRLKNNDATNGTVRVTSCGSGGIVSFIDTGVRAATVDFNLFGDVRAYCPVTVHDLTFRAGTVCNDGTYTIAVNGTFKTAVTTMPNVQLQNGSTFDLRDWATAFETGSALSFADGATVNLDLTGRRLTNGIYVVTWETTPANLESLTFKAVSHAALSLLVRDDGIRVFAGLLISIR